MKPYLPEVEAEMKKFHQTLSEKDKRRYAAVEALKLGHGGIVYMAKLLGCDRNTIREGIKELKHLPEDSRYDQRIRRAGGGRKPYTETHPGIDEKFLDVLADHTAGDPMDDQVRWTNTATIGAKHKKTTMKEVAHRNEQFENIARLKTAY